MMEKARRIIFYLFMLVYIVLCPALILYSFGYVFHPPDREVRHTGLLYVSTAPKGADIFLEKIRYRHKTPASIEHLLPDTYRIKLKLKGHQPWSHNINIKAGQASVFDNVILIPKKFKQRIVPADNREELMRLMQRRPMREPELKLYNLPEKGIRGVVSSNYTGKLLYWTKGSIWLTTRSKKHAKPVKVYSGAGSIEQCFWAYRGSHIIFKEGDNVNLLQLYSDGETRQERIVTCYPGSSIYYHDSRGRLYYIDRRTKEVVSIKAVVL